MSFKIMHLKDLRGVWLVQLVNYFPANLSLLRGTQPNLILQTTEHSVYLLRVRLWFVSIWNDVGWFIYFANKLRKPLPRNIVWVTRGFDLQLPQSTIPIKGNATLESFEPYPWSVQSNTKCVEKETVHSQERRRANPCLMFTRRAAYKPLCFSAVHWK